MTELRLFFFPPQKGIIPHACGIAMTVSDSAWHSAALAMSTPCPLLPPLYSFLSFMEPICHFHLEIFHCGLPVLAVCYVCTSGSSGNNQLCWEGEKKKKQKNLRLMTKVDRPRTIEHRKILLTDICLPSCLRDERKGPQCSSSFKC